MGQPDFKIVMSRPGKVMRYNKIHNSTKNSPIWTEVFAFVFCLSFFSVTFLLVHIFCSVSVNLQ